MSISTHILDTALGRPAAGVKVTLEARDANGDWSLLKQSATNEDGRIAELAPEPGGLAEGVYRLRFDTDSYQHTFYPEVAVTFRIEDATQHYHVPLLLSRYSYSTYRGS